MSFLERLQADLKKSMLEKERDKTRTLRLLISKLKDKKIELRKDLTEVEEIAVLKKAAKERQESMATYLQADRNDLAEAEEVELKIIKVYLPEELGDAAIENAVKAVIAETGAQSMRDMGMVMKGSMSALAGKADGKRVQAAVKKLLG